MLSRLRRLAILEIASAYPKKTFSPEGTAVNSQGREPLGQGTREPLGQGTREPLGQGTREPLGQGTREPLGQGTREPLGRLQFDVPSPVRGGRKRWVLSPLTGFWDLGSSSRG
jgi:hypothetical protein